MKKRDRTPRCCVKMIFSVSLHPFGSLSRNVLSRCFIRRSLDPVHSRVLLLWTPLLWITRYEDTPLGYKLRKCVYFCVVITKNSHYKLSFLFVCFFPRNGVVRFNETSLAKIFPVPWSRFLLVAFSSLASQFSLLAVWYYRLECGLSFRSQEMEYLSHESVCPSAV